MAAELVLDSSATGKRSGMPRATYISRTFAFDTLNVKARNFWLRPRQWRRTSWEGLQE